MKSRGFTLIELLVSLFVMALLAALSWRGLDGMMRSRQVTEAYTDQVMTLQTGLAQWNSDLDAITEFPGLTALAWNGRVLRLTRTDAGGGAAGARVVAWTDRGGQWLRWQSPAVTSRGALDAAWQQADLWSQNPSDSMRQNEVVVAPLEDWQIFYYRDGAWVNPQSSSATTNTTTSTVLAATAAGTRTSTLPQGVRMVLQLPPGRAISGQMVRDWVKK
ncbi:prepilin-type N-terminal cleavage/methylation domain-containing protein [Ramlibacter sp. G-1-2-2]|uniref:Prepilin-type N-terminal cleavage/methylation domain-containing protein n=1 Tax=Ramlibacter agri TaxID=2728837 RepID=A0A848HDY5_9BURK|nr:prepilin-type N-terminal cleavage/methylation domain-containing protein [Ramlibacter agri]NML48382.1 prepilin-type N-terminal cleavage/methylation domain-containing protein [Ramlibacter agri]